MESVPRAVATGSQLIARIEFATMLPGRYRSRYWLHPQLRPLPFFDDCSLFVRRL